jgi:hypothetical protein
MKKAQRHLRDDFILILISLAIAFFIGKSGIAHALVASLIEFKLLGIFVAGMFFTSIFTTAPAIVLLGQFAETTSLAILVPMGGLGAMVGDFVIFSFVRDRMVQDVKYLLSFSKGVRFFKIFNTKLFRFFVPSFGALIIASPLPDELGIAMLGLSKVKTKSFFTISFIFNCLGILVIGWIAKEIIG